MHTTSTERQPVIIDLPQATVLRYHDASDEVEHTLGLSPGPEFLMGLAVEHEDPFELASVFLAEIIEALRNPENAVKSAH